MSITQIDIDDEALAAAMKLMGTTTEAETVDNALREYTACMERLEAAERLAAGDARG
ncbi:type II toxin-antitoxin system VapB family antitoxin [Kitasatospora sp. NA04385]|nr:type II toxin-antitoxin system VapB family antitoxin [Kitasatospora sp. NA04385]